MPALLRIIDRCSGAGKILQIGDYRDRFAPAASAPCRTSATSGE
jgi:hypothetical protein